MTTYRELVARGETDWVTMRQVEARMLEKLNEAYAAENLALELDLLFGDGRHAAYFDSLPSIEKAAARIGASGNDR